MDLPERLAEIDRLPLDLPGRQLARLVALMNASGIAMDSAEAERVGDALAQACHDAKVPTGRVRRLVDPDSAAFVRGVTEFMARWD